eukprot:gene2446-1539_t
MLSGTTRWGRLAPRPPLAGPHAPAPPRHSPHSACGSIFRDRRLAPPSHGLQKGEAHTRSRGNRGNTQPFHVSPGSPSSSPFAIRKSIPKRNTSDSILLKIKGYESVNTCPHPPLNTRFDNVSLYIFEKQTNNNTKATAINAEIKKKIKKTSEKRSLLKRIIITRVQVVSGPTFQVLLNVSQSKGTMGKIKSNIFIFLEHHTVSPEEIWGCSPRTYLNYSF